MNETRWVLAAFAVTALVMVLLPVGLFASALNESAATEKGLDGAVSQIFLATAKASQSLEQKVPSVTRVLTEGMSESAARRVLAASDFVCRAAPGELDCGREHNTSICNDEWQVVLSLDGQDAVRSTSARRWASCL